MFRQRYNRFVPVKVRDNRIRKKVGINACKVAVLLKACEVLAVFDNHTRACSSALVVNDVVVIPLEFATPKADKRTFRTAKNSTKAFRLVDGERFSLGIIGAECKTVRRKS